MNIHSPRIGAAAPPKFLPGWKVFPLHPGTKKPIHDGWPERATDDPEQIARWNAELPGCGWGLAMGPSGLGAIDIDGPIGEETLFDFQLAEGQLFETREHRSARGGRHLIFSDPDRTLRNSASRLGPKLDTRGQNGFIVIPPSTFEGGTYEVIADRPVAPLPPFVVAALGRKHEAAKAPDNITLDTAANIGRVITLLRGYVASGHVAIEGRGGDDCTYAVACEVLNFGLSEDKALEIIDAEWNPHCSPPWSHDDLALKVSNAAAYAQNEQGVWAVAPVQERIPPAALSKLLAESVSAVGAEGPQPISELLGRTIDPVQEIIAGLVERGVPTFLAGGGGSNKSRTALHWGLSIDASTPIYGRAVQAATFVYVSAEDHHDEVARRAQAITRRLKLSAGGQGLYLDRVGRDSALAVMSEGGGCETTPFYRQLCDDLSAIAGHKFVVLDSTYNFVRFQGKAKIDEGAVNAFVTLLQRICTETNSTLLVLWHPSQAGQERGDASGWSVAWHNAPRARLSITPVKDTEDAYELKVEKRNHSAKGKPITLYWSDGVLLPRGDTDIAERGVRFVAACVRVAIMAAEHGAPIQGQKRLVKWMTDEIENDAGFRPSDREVKETLSGAMRAGKLRYLKGTNRRMAGYYPTDPLKAEELAIQAKKNGVSDD